VIEKIGIIGDVHSEHRRLHQALDWLERQAVDAVICTGDIADGRGCIEECWRALAQAQVHTVAGNHDRWLLTDQQRHVRNAHFRTRVSEQGLVFLKSLPKVIRLNTACGELRLCHGVGDDDMAKVWPGTETTAIRRSEVLDAWLAESGSPRFVINGHMHFRTLIDFERCFLINAGTLKGERAGITLLDMRTRQVAGFNLLDDGRVCATQRYSLDGRSDRRVWSSTAAFDGRWMPTSMHRRAH
jgi:predicted phosphodiesterase